MKDMRWVGKDWKEIFTVSVAAFKLKLICSKYNS